MTEDVCMKKTVVVKGINIGEGIPKICTPMVGKSKRELMKEANLIKNLEADLVEWRVDFFEDVQDIPKIEEALFHIRQVLVDKPIIFTLRTRKEGGQADVSTAFYFHLNKIIVETGLVDMMDIELFNDNRKIEELIHIAHKAGVKVILSSHDFIKTPTREEIISRLCKSIELGCDIPKIAVMPNTAQDVITLLDASRIVKEEYLGPIIAVSMGGKGLISRFTGELFGSDITFAAARTSSAPGQISVTDLRSLLGLIHDNIIK